MDFGHAYILATILLTTYSQLVMRWQVGLAGQLPATTDGKATFVAMLLLNPWVLSGVLATFLAGVSWMMALTRFQISYAYPFIALTYIAVLLLAATLFHETISAGKLAGTALVVLGVVVIARFG